jgi:hypothetical protein
MRLRSAVPASLLAALAVAVAPSVASAAPSHNRGLTINVIPNPILAGESVKIYGQLNNAPVASQTIVLYHHLSGSHPGYTKVGQTTTFSNGTYEFSRPEGIVTTNRSWFVTETGHPGVHSRTVAEHVAALVSLTASVPATSTGYDTNHAIVFSGHVTPNHPHQRVYLQEQTSASGDDWSTIASGRLNRGSNYAIRYRWAHAGFRDMRVVFAGDQRNVRGESAALTIQIQQTQVTGFTIKSSAPIIEAGAWVTISGTLDQGDTTTPEPSTSVTLWSRADGQPYRAITSTVTRPDGSYRFSPQTPINNVVYEVRTTLPANRHSAQLFEGVRDVVSLAASSTSSTVGGHVTFTGHVNPDKAGHAIELQRRGADGDYHTVARTHVNSSSNYQFGWTFGSTGSRTFRTEITGGPENLGNHSAPATITVSPAPSLSALPPAS